VKQLRDTVWQRRGTSWLWDDTVTKSREVVSLRQWLRIVGHWPDDLPSNGGNTMVVAGLDGCLDLLPPGEAETWLADEMKRGILSFQDAYSGEAALIFWLPHGERRVQVHPASEAVLWRCGPPHTGAELEFGRILWGEAREYPQEILLANHAQPTGLFHLRIT
jgi:hypothetical protein